VSAGTPVRNYDSTNVAPTQTNPSSHPWGDAISRHTNALGTDINLVMGSDGARNPRTAVLARTSSNFSPRLVTILSLLLWWKVFRKELPWSWTNACNIKINYFPGVFPLKRIWFFFAICSTTHAFVETGRNGQLDGLKYQGYLIIAISLQVE
jgi:hypothetical protein